MPRLFRTCEGFVNVVVHAGVSRAYRQSVLGWRDGGAIRRPQSVSTHANDGYRHEQRSATDGERRLACIQPTQLRAVEVDAAKGDGPPQIGGGGAVEDVRRDDECDR